jgi:hypothetical protein
MNKVADGSARIFVCPYSSPDSGCFAFVVSAAGFDAVACILCQLSVGLDMNWLRGVSACVSLARAILMQVHPFFYFH